MAESSWAPPFSAARPLEKDYRSAAKAAGRKRTLRIGNALGCVLPCDAQLDLAARDHIAEQFEPLSTFQDFRHKYRLDLDSPLARFVSPAANRDVDAVITDGAKGTFREQCRV